MTPTRAVFTVAQPDGTTIRVACQPNTGLHDRTDKLLGEALHLIELLRQPEVGRHLLELAYTHPGRDQLTHFQARLPLPGNGLYLRHEPDGALHRIAEIEVVGDFRWKLEPLDLHLAAFLETRFAFGHSPVAEYDILAVALLDAMGAPWWHEPQYPTAG